MTPTLLQHLSDLACRISNAAARRTGALAGKLFWAIGIRPTDSLAVARLRVLYLCPLALLLTVVVGVVRLAFWGTIAIVHSLTSVAIGAVEVLWGLAMNISELISIPFQRGWMQVTEAVIAWNTNPADEE